jgi:hypothetical protein
MAKCFFKTKNQLFEANKEQLKPEPCKEQVDQHSAIIIE